MAPTCLARASAAVVFAPLADRSESPTHCAAERHAPLGPYRCRGEGTQGSDLGDALFVSGSAFGHEGDSADLVGTSKIGFAAGTTEYRPSPRERPLWDDLPVV